MEYFNYHAKAKRLINDGHLVRASIVEKYRHISPALVLYFDEYKPMPIREYRFFEYLDIINIPIDNQDNYDLYRSLN